MKFIYRSVILAFCVFYLILIGNNAVLALFYDLFHTADEYLSLQKYNVEPEFTVSGLSSGGALSVMLSFIFSSLIKGVGVFAGVPYPWGIMLIENPTTMGNFSRYITWIDYLSSRGFIDSTKHLQRTRAYVFHGLVDNSIPLPAAEFIKSIYRHYEVQKLRDMVGKVPAGHCIPTKTYFLPCSIGNGLPCACGYNGVYDMFRTILPDFVHPKVAVTSSIDGNLFKFNMNEFFPGGNATHFSWAEYGWAYVPTQCGYKAGNGTLCRLHFLFSSCNVAAESWINIYPELLRSAGYLEAADANNLILIYPVTVNEVLWSAPLFFAFEGCQELVGYTSLTRITYSTKFGVVPQAVKKIYERVYKGL